MINTPDQRLSRSQRKKLKRNPKAIVALSLAVALLFIVIVKENWKTLGRLSPVDFPGGHGREESTALADSIVVRNATEFKISETVYKDTLLSQPDGPAYTSWRLPWPDKLPFEIISDRLRNSAEKEGFRCDCSEFAGAKYAICNLMKNDFIAAQVRIERNSRAKLKDRALAFVFRNIGALDNKRILQLIDTGVPVTYFGDPNTYPSGSTKRALEKAGVTTILELPSKSSGLIDLRNNSEKKLADGDFMNRLMADIFVRHPSMIGLLLDESGGYDLPLVKSAIRRAGVQKVVYLYEREKPDYSDSLAYSGGLIIVRMKNVADLTETYDRGTMARLIGDLIQPHRPNRITAILDASKISPDDFRGFPQSCAGLGIKLMNCIDLADTLQSIQRIDK